MLNTQAGHWHYFICNFCGEASGGALHLDGKNLFAPPNDSKSMKNVSCPYCDVEGNMRISTCQESIEHENKQREFFTDP